MSPADAGAESMRRALQACHNTPPPPSSVSSSQPGQSPRSTIWPEEKKGLLADVAKKFLEGLEVNKGKTIDVRDVHAMLNQNPSYNLLCAMLNHRGFQFGRQPFAQTLLSVVPAEFNASKEDSTKDGRGRLRKDGSNGSPNASKQSSNYRAGVRWHSNLTQAAVSTTKSNTRGLSTSGTMTSPDSHPNYNNAMPPSLPILSGPNSVAPEYKSYYERMKMIGSGSPSTQSQSKQQASKKRNFSELVDLSLDTDNDDTQTKKQQGGTAGGANAGKE